MIQRGGQVVIKMLSDVKQRMIKPLITETIETVSPVERTVQDSKGETYLLRIRPYKTPDTRIDGAVIALFDLEPAKSRKGGSQ